MNQPNPEIEDAVTAAARIHWNLKQDLAEVRAQLAIQERAHELALNTITQLEQQIRLLSESRDMYMRHSTELVTRMNDIGIMVSTSLEDAANLANRKPVTTRPSVDEESLLHSTTQLPEITIVQEPAP